MFNLFQKKSSPPNKLPMTPLVRLSMSFAEALGADKSGALLDLRSKYIERQRAAEVRKNDVFKGLFVIEAALAALLSGQQFTIPIIDVKTSEIPAAIEIVTIASALGALIFVLEFVNWAAYDMIVRNYGISDGKQANIDPDFINAADIQLFLSLKLFQPKLNIWGSDEFESGTFFSIFGKAVSSLLALILLAFPFLHFLMTATSIYLTFSAYGFDLASIVYFALVVLMNILALTIWIATYRDFPFYIRD